MLKPKPLAERIAVLRAEIDKVIDDHVDEIAATCPGIPKPALRQMLTNRAPGCQCRQVALIEKAEAA